MARRRSCREYVDEPISLADVGQVLWAAQGITGSDLPRRTAPSAGATYPIEVYLAAGRVQGLTPGVYRYVPASHALDPVSEGSVAAESARGDVRAQLAGAALGQEFLAQAAAVLIIAAAPERTTERYGSRGKRYVHMEAGHVAQNVSLQATALRLGTVVVAAFRDEDVRRVAGMGEEPLCLMPLGHPRQGR